MKYLVAVSGGVDSVVLLHLMVQSWIGTAEGTRRKPSFSGRAELWDSLPKLGGGQSPPLIVAHFDHGIRPDSAADACFVEALAARYGVPFVGKREELGKDASEEYARDRRYAFLKAEAKKHGARLVTAHHADDVIETVALNLTRGTGWRGLAVLDSPDISRPLLSFSKEQVYQYAVKKRLEWVEDSTNASDAYARNRLRRRIGRELSNEGKKTILEVWHRQLVLKDNIETEAVNLLAPQGAQYSRYFFTYIDPLAATELLRLLVVEAIGHSIPRPQLHRALLAIKTARSGTLFPLGATWLVFGVKTFSIPVKTP